MNLTNNWNVGINLGDAETVKLKTIVDDLVDSKAVNSSDIEDFLRFTLFIVFDEYEKNKDSLRKFYRLNLEKYVANKSSH
ncbi:MAG TPA: hypothetical protein VJR94_12900 [Candidatus Nitrosocosmicus sp.]|nr:hypothetical protein [Candidatus Nitrosocosmicus sp.]